jgi:hypothetical protein
MLIPQVGFTSSCSARRIPARGQYIAVLTWVRYKVLGFGEQETGNRERGRKLNVPHRNVKFIQTQFFGRRLPLKS